MSAKRENEGRGCAWRYENTRFPRHRDKRLAIARASRERPGVRPVWTSAAALAASLLVSMPTRADEAPTRPEKHESDELPPPSVRLPTLLGGVAFTAAWWGLNTGTSYIWPDSPGFTDLRTPIIGPWKAIAHNECRPDCDFPHYFQYIYYALSGIAQAGGVGIALESLLVPTSRGGASRPVSPAPSTTSPGPTRDEPTGPSTPPPSPTTPLFFLPQPVRIGQGGWGVGVGGLF